MFKRRSDRSQAAERPLRRLALCGRTFAHQHHPVLARPPTPPRPSSSASPARTARRCRCGPCRARARGAAPRRLPRARRRASRCPGRSRPPRARARRTSAVPSRRSWYAARMANAALVTGGNSGIGFECARALAQRGWQVLIASRNRALSAAAVRGIARECGDDAAAELPLDLGSLASVRALAQEIERRDVPLRALVCNAGTARSTAGRHLSARRLRGDVRDQPSRPLSAHQPAARAPDAQRAGAHRHRRLRRARSGRCRHGMPKPRSPISPRSPRPGDRGAATRSTAGLAYVNSEAVQRCWFAYELDRRGSPPPACRTARSGCPSTASIPDSCPESGLARDYPRALRFVWDRILPGLARAFYPSLSTVSGAQGRRARRHGARPESRGVSGKYFPSHCALERRRRRMLSYDASRRRALGGERADERAQCGRVAALS